MKFIEIKPGKFMMGSNEYEDEKPIHQVEITKPFEMMDAPVTQKQWEEVMGNNPSCFSGPNRPVENVSWHDCQEFIKKMNEKNDGYTYRLPTEAEWEYCCRAGTSTKWFHGDDENGLKEYAHFNSRETCDVKTKKPNPWGLYDMCGNVWEWCQDWYGRY